MKLDFNWNEAQRHRDSVRCINTAEVPTTCRGCRFITYRHELVCELTGADVYNERRPTCTVYDFTKYLLENI